VSVDGSGENSSNNNNVIDDDDDDNDESLMEIASVISPSILTTATATTTTATGNSNNNNNNSSSSSSSSSSNNNNNVIDDEPGSASEDAVQRLLLKVLQVHQSVNNTLDKYRSKLCQKGSVHRKKHASNTIEAGTSGFIVPDHDNNQRTHKRRLQSTYSAGNKESAF